MAWSSGWRILTVFIIRSKIIMLSVVQLDGWILNNLISALGEQRRHTQAKHSKLSENSCGRGCSIMRNENGIMVDLLDVNIKNGYCLSLIIIYILLILTSLTQENPTEQRQWRSYTKSRQTKGTHLKLNFSLSTFEILNSCWDNHLNIPYILRLVLSRTLLSMSWVENRSSFCLIPF